ISAVTQMRVGAGENGSAWGSNIRIEGGIFARDVNVAGALNLLDSTTLLGGAPATSRLSARNTIDLGNGLTTIGSGAGAAVTNNFDAHGQRETRVASGQTFYRASVGGDSGKVAFLPLGQDANFFRRGDYATGMSNAISRTTWDEYAWGARQCAMSIEIREMAGTRPTAITFHYRTNSGMASKDLREGDVDWPNYNGNVGVLASSPPFYVDTIIADGTTSFFINLEELAYYVRTVLGGRAVAGRNNVRMNDSLCIWTNDAIAGLTKPGMISDNTTMAVVLAKCADMTNYNDGFSLVTDHRVFFSGDFNQVPLAAGRLAGSGLPGGTELFPAVSVFAPTIRYGTNAPANINISGQITSLKTDVGEVNPLDLKESITGASQTIAPTRINADLSQIVSPAQLPPINKMSWLVTVEEIHP
ncbi:MAG: hypothetical protein L3J39_18670, partial [Verrucomicrobiales bacterium]|nr:hypothetical protein [Verrucomicrobiales bacterium]